MDEINPDGRRRWFRREFKKLLDCGRYTQDQLSGETRIGRSTFAQYSTGRVARTSTDFVARLLAFLRKAGYPDPEKIAIAHLFDEAEECGIDPAELKITLDGLHQSIYPAIADLSKAAGSSEGWAQAIEALAVLARNDAAMDYAAGNTGLSAMQKVAESSAPAPSSMDKRPLATYDPPKVKRKRNGKP